MLKAHRAGPSALITFERWTTEARDRKAGSASGIALLIHETNFTRGSRKKCLENLIVAHKKAPRETARGHCKDEKKTENGGKMKSIEKMMPQKTLQVKRHNGPHSREILLLAIFRYGHRMDVAMEQVENAVRERRQA
jgi:hypothetical protein